MKNRYRFLRKSYAMHRMVLAIERAIEAPTGKQKEKAARWAAAWGLLCGIRTTGVRLRLSEIRAHPDEPALYALEQISIRTAQPARPMPPIQFEDTENNKDLSETAQDAVHQHWPLPPGPDAGSQV